MAKKRTKEIIPEKTPQKRGTDSYSYEKACNAAKNSGTPTYRFAVGDRVQVGHLPNCVVEEVMDDGAMYLIRVTTKDHVEYSCWAWTSVRPLDDDKDTHFAKRNSALLKVDAKFFGRTLFLRKPKNNSKKALHSYADGV